MLFILDSQGVPSVARIIRLDTPSSLSLTLFRLMQPLQATLNSTMAIPAKAIGWETKKAAWENASKASFCRSPGNGNEDARDWQIANSNNP
jgi:hypothetical protein